MTLHPGMPVSMLDGRRALIASVWARLERPTIIWTLTDDLESLMCGPEDFEVAPPNEPAAWALDPARQEAAHLEREVCDVPERMLGQVALLVLENALTLYDAPAAREVVLWDEQTPKSIRRALDLAWEDYSAAHEADAAADDATHENAVKHAGALIWLLQAGNLAQQDWLDDVSSAKSEARRLLALGIGSAPWSEIEARRTRYTVKTLLASAQTEATYA